MISGGKTLNLTPAQLAERVQVVKKAREGVEAAGNVLKDYWTETLERGDGVNVPRPRTGKLAGSIRMVPRHGASPRATVGTPVFYGRILHFGVPGRIEAMPHGEVALNRAEPDMNAAFRKAMR